MADLAALLEKEASAEIEAILSEARARASEIIAKAEAEAEALRAQRLRQAEAQHEAALVRARSAAQLEAASMKLRAQHQAVEAVFDDVRQEIDALINDPKRYQSILKALLEEVVAGVGSNEVKEVLVNPADVALAKKVVADLGLDATVKPDESVRGGVRVRGRRSVAVENTLYGRLEALRDDLAAEVSKALMAKGG